MVRRLVFLLLLVPILLSGTAARIAPAGRALACCPAPPIYTYQMIYRLDHGRWQPALVVAEGDRIRFRLSFYTPQPGWQKPRGNLTVQPLTPIGGKTPQYAQPVLAGATLTRVHSYTMYRLLGGTLRIGTGKRWLGMLTANFNLTNGQGGIGASLQFLVVRPPEPAIPMVSAVMSACRRAPAKRSTGWISGFFNYRATAYPPYTGWLAPVFLPGYRLSTRNALYVVLPSRILAPNQGPPPKGLIFAHGAIHCGAHSFVLDQYPLYP